MILLGLTGGIACGKTTVCNLLAADYDVTIIDCDAIVHELQRPNAPAVKAIAQQWPHCVSNDGVLLRDALGAVVFSDPVARRKLASIMNWRIVVKVLSEILRLWWKLPAKAIVILDAPLLFETNIFTRVVVASVVVFCDSDTQSKRLMKRNPNLSLQECEQRIKSQMPLEQKVKRAQYVLDNSRDAEIDAQVAQCHRWMGKQRCWSRWSLEWLCVAVGGLIAVAGCVQWLSSS